MKLFVFYRGLYGGEKLQNHALNSRVNGEFRNKVLNGEEDKDLIIVNEGKYALHVDYLYVDGIDISKIAIKMIEKYIDLLRIKDSNLIDEINALLAVDSVEEKRIRIKNLLEENAEARVFEIISFSILKNHYKNIPIYIGYSIKEIHEEFLTLYKTGRTNANDGGIDFVMRPVGRFFQVTEVSNYDKYLLDIDKVMHFPITFVVKTESSKLQIETELKEYISRKTGGMAILVERYEKAIEEVITINELRNWMMELNNNSIDELLDDIKLYYSIELNLPLDD
jgi:hypothetical protein